MITKQQIETCNNGQQLADWAAEYCMGWTFKAIKGLKDGFYLAPDKKRLPRLHWQPHQPTEKGKAQAIDLAEKYRLSVNPYMLTAYIFKAQKLVPDKESWQIAVLKAALLLEIGDSDERQ